MKEGSWVPYVLTPLGVLLSVAHVTRAVAPQVYGGAIAHTFPSLFLRRPIQEAEVIAPYDTLFCCSSITSTVSIKSLKMHLNLILVLNIIIKLVLNIVLNYLKVSSTEKLDLTKLLICLC